MPVNEYDKTIRTKLPEWQAIRDVLEGERAVKAAKTTYLKKLPGQKVVNGPDGQQVDLYENYLERTVLLPFAGPFIARVIGIVFRKEPVFQMPTVELDDQLENISLEAPAVDEENFAKAVFRENATTGHGAIVVDFSTRAQRPYQRLYPAGTIGRVWWGMNGDRPEPVRVTLKECVVETKPGNDPFAVEEIEQWRVIELSPDAPLTPEQRNAAAAMGPDRYPLGYLQHQLYREERDASGNPKGQWSPYGDPVVPDRRGAPLWFLPIVPFTPFATSWNVEKPPLLDLVELVLADYRLSADYYTLLHKCGAGTILFGTGIPSSDQSKLQAIGAGIALLTENPGAALNYVQTNGQAGSEIRQARIDLRGDMSIALGRLLLSQQKNVAESGAAMEIQFAGDDATLQQIAGTTALALESSSKIHAWWMGTEETPDQVEVDVELNDAFVKKGFTPQELIELATFADMGGMTDQDFYSLLKRSETLDSETTFAMWQASRRPAEPKPTDLGTQAMPPQDEGADEAA